MTTEVQALSGAWGDLARCRIVPGQRHDSVEVAPLIDGISLGRPIADKAIRSNARVAAANDRSAKTIVSQHPRRARQLIINASISARRHPIDNLVCKFKEPGRIATRRCETDQSRVAMVYLTATVIASR